MLFRSKGRQSGGDRPLHHCLPLSNLFLRPCRRSHSEKYVQITQREGRKWANARQDEQKMNFLRLFSLWRTVQVAQKTRAKFYIWNRTAQEKQGKSKFFVAKRNSTDYNTRYSCSWEPLGVPGQARPNQAHYIPWHLRPGPGYVADTFLPCAAPTEGQHPVGGARVKKQ